MLLWKLLRNNFFEKTIFLIFAIYVVPLGQLGKLWNSSALVSVLCQIYCYGFDNWLHEWVSTQAEKHFQSRWFWFRWIIHKQVGTYPYKGSSRFLKIWLPHSGLYFGQFSKLCYSFKKWKKWKIWKEIEELDSLKRLHRFNRINSRLWKTRNVLSTQQLEHSTSWALKTLTKWTSRLKREPP